MHHVLLKRKRSYATLLLRLCETSGRQTARFLNKERVKLLSADEGTTFIYANLFRQLRTQGTPIPTNDLWIAALTIQHGLLLFSRDTHFNRLPQIPIV